MLKEKNQSTSTTIDSAQNATPTDLDASVATQPTAQNHLNARHYQECIEKRGLNPQWILANCFSVNALQATQRLGYKALSDGIELRGCNHQSQFKPDKAWKKEDDHKAPKYRSPMGEYDALLPTHPTDPYYWDDIEALKQKAYKIDGHPCLVLSEGFFKAIAGCSNDLPTIALLGVEMGLTPKDADPQGKRYLVPTLERYARAGFGFIIAFDADCATNENVIVAQRKLVHQIKLFKVPVYSVTGLWQVDESFSNKNKGMDDYIYNHSGDRFKREVLGKAVDIAAWEKQFTNKRDDSKAHSNKKADFPVPRKTALEIAERYKNQWAYHHEQQTWRRFNGKVWEAVHLKVFGQIIFNEVEAMGVEYRSDSFIENVIKTLERKLLVPEWVTFDRMKWIAFNNGVLEVETGLLHPHSPGFRFTNYLKRDYTALNVIDPNTVLLDLLRIHAPECYSWFMQVQNGDPLKVLKLLAIINGVIKYRFFDLQMFVQLFGAPGTGKSTFARILQGIVGKGNYQGSRLSKLNDDNEIAKIIDTQLVICPDEKKQVGDFGGLLSLTGGDPISYRKIYQSASTGFFLGTVLLISNVPLFAGDTSGIDRRLCLATFDQPIPASMRDTSIEQRLESELSPLTAIALAMPDQLVTDLIKGIGLAEIPDFKRESWLHKTINDSVALFVEERLVNDPQAEIMLGGKSGDILFTAYGAYMAFVDENNSKSYFSSNNFRHHLVEVCREAGWQGVKAKRMNNGWKLCGIRLRRAGIDDAIPRVSEVFDPLPCRACNPSVGMSVGLESAYSMESVARVGLEPNNEQKNQLKEFGAKKYGQPSTQQDISLPPPNPPIKADRIFQAEPPKEFNQNLDELVEEKILKEGHKPVTPTQPKLDLDFSLTLDSTPAAPPTPPASDQEQPPRELAAIILGCKTWVAALEAMDAVANAVGKQRQIVFRYVLKHIRSLEDRQHLVKLLASHIRQFPRDYWAYNWLPDSCHQLKQKAISQASGRNAESE